MDSFVPKNTVTDLMIYFSCNEKPITRTEFAKFWGSCTLTEKHYYMCADISEGRTEGNVQLDSSAWDCVNLKDFIENVFDGNPPKLWCENLYNLPPHYHTAKGLIPRGNIESVSLVEDDGSHSLMGISADYSITDEWQPEHIDGPLPGVMERLEEWRNQVWYKDVPKPAVLKPGWLSGFKRPTYEDDWHPETD